MARSFRADLWAAAYLINSGASDDGFEYFRGWLIVQGRDVFERAVADPDSRGAYSLRCPASDPAWDFDIDDEAEMLRRLPRLAGPCAETGR